MESTFKQDIRLGLPDDEQSYELCKRFREAQLEEEAALDPNHRSLYEFILKYPPENILEVLGFVSNIPIGYAGFSPCGCGCKNRLIWNFFYIPVKLRKYGLGLRFARASCRWLQEKLGPDVVIEITHHEENSAMNQIFRYAGFKKTRTTGELSLGEILRRQNGS